MILVSDTIRYLLTFLSFPHNLKKEKLSKSQNYLIKKLKDNKFNKKNYVNDKLLTHEVFSNTLLNIIKKGQLKDFLRLGFIQKMFFVHNRFYNYKFLRKIYNSKKKLWINLLNENSIGNPVPFFLNKKTSGNRIRHVYLAKKICSYVNFSRIDSVIELGGGYGCMASIFCKINRNIDYTIYDLPEVNLLQYYYLNSLGIKTSNSDYKSQVSLISKITEIQKKIILLKKKKKKILILANWSLSEMPISLRNNLKFLFTKCDYAQISYQSRFENISNKKYFYDLKQELSKNFISKINQIYEMNNYFGKNTHYNLQIKKK
ncbi:putative sugar O-methyltransferase [Pelagibacterales bacterium SAG-MED23]|nr:putative sugar O-methyltransferase [Pelagibacterales bacterium SAG-MED23]